MDLWFDTDPGFDDWMAWALIASEPSFRLHGVSVVAGNAPLDITLPNALAIKAWHDFTVPVHAGCDRPLVQPRVTAQDVLGDDGMSTTGARLPPAAGAGARPAPGHGVQAFIDCVRAHPGRITLLAIGPLTNIATAFALAPDVPALLAGIVIMGGATHGGNTTAVAEFNIWADPEAAARVFECGVPVAMFGLNLCRQFLIGPAQVDRLKALGGDRAAMFAGYLDGYVAIATSRGRAGQPLYDPAPVIWLARPDLFTLQRGRVDVELQGRFTRGMTVCDLRPSALARANAQVAMQVDAEAAMEWAMQRLAALLG